MNMLTRLETKENKDIFVNLTSILRNIKQNF